MLARNLLAFLPKSRFQDTDRGRLGIAILRISILNQEVCVRGFFLDGVSAVVSVAFDFHRKQITKGAFCRMARGKRIDSTLGAVNTIMSISMCTAV